VIEREFRHLGDRLVYQGHIWKVVVAEFVAPDGDQFTRDIVRSPGAVAAVPLHDDGTVVLVRQYRPPFDERIIEIPAGMRDVVGEPVELTAHRELAEEVGLEAGRLELLSRFVPAAGMTDSVLHVFLATGLREVARQTHGPEEADMEVLRLPLDEAVAMVVDGRICDAKTVIGLLLADRRRRDEPRL
jgi:ADP-ribose pyrophosphatase